MRKIGSVIVFVLATLSLQAQLFIRPEAGMVTSKTYTTDVWNAGWKAGVGLEYRFKRDGVFSLLSGTYYQTETGTTVPTVWLATQDYKMYINGGSYKRQSLSVPLLAKVSWKLSDQIRIHAAAGPSFNIRFNGKWKNHTDEIDYKLADGGTVIYNPYWSYAYYTIPKQNEQGTPYDEWQNAMIAQKRTSSNNTYYDSGIELSAAFNIGVEFNRLCVNLYYEAHPEQKRTYYNSYGYSGYGYNGSYSEDKWGIARHRLSLTIGYTFQLTK